MSMREIDQARGLARGLGFLIRPDDPIDRNAPLEIVGNVEAATATCDGREVLSQLSNLDAFTDRFSKKRSATKNEKIFISNAGALLHGVLTQHFEKTCGRRP